MAELREQSEQEHARVQSDAVEHRLQFYFTNRDGVQESAGYVQMQKGPVAEVGPNGTFPEPVIEALIRFLAGVNRAVPSRETALAITKLQEGLFWLNERTRVRTAQRVEGSYQRHES